MWGIPSLSRLTKLQSDLGSATENCLKPPKNKKKWGPPQKMRFSRKKPLRTPGAIRKYPLTGGAEAHNGAPDGPHGNETQKNIRGNRGGARRKTRAHTVTFVLYAV